MVLRREEEKKKWRLLKFLIGFGPEYRVYLGRWETNTPHKIYSTAAVQPTMAVHYP